LIPPPKSLEETTDWIQSIIDQYQRTGVGRLAVVEKASSDFIGWAGLKVESNVNGHKTFYDLGYRLMSQYWGKGYASEAARAIVAFGFEALQVDEICAYIEQGNDSSRRVAENAGLRVTSTFIGERTDEWWLEIRKNEYDGNNAYDR
jgi:[ribosomal protein S5]-alanine N-acetyltransferase